MAARPEARSCSGPGGQRGAIANNSPSRRMVRAPQSIPLENCTKTHTHTHTAQHSKHRSGVNRLRQPLPPTLTWMQWSRQEYWRLT